MRRISKRFGSVQALEGVDLQVEQGEIHAVVGENGAGKTTLMRILYGDLQPDAGSIEVDGKGVQFKSAADAIAAGIGMVSQHFSVIPELGCLENLILGAETGAVMNRKETQREADALAQKMGFAFDWYADASTLSPGGKQKLEILKLLWRKARIMILDEPTAMLSPADSDALFESLKQLAGQGATVILVTHRLPEVLSHCQRVTVLRNGGLVGSRKVSETNSSELAEMIVGHALAPARKREPSVGDLLLELRDLIVIGKRGENAVKEASLSLRRGEIVGIAGVDGSGQRELFSALMGVSRPRSGRAVATLASQTKELFDLSVAERIRGGLRLIPEDRHEEGLVDDWPLELNAALGLQRLSPFARGKLVDSEGRKSMAQKIAERFGTKHAGLSSHVRNLSGGNQQRFVAGRALAVDPKLIFAFQPARGLDVDGTRSVYEGIRQECEKGAAALVVSFDLDELLENCDRILVMNGGRILAPSPGRERDRAEIGRLMVGAQ